MKTALAEVTTENATSLLRQLCRHWAHKFPVTFNDEHGTIELPAAVCTLDAGAALLKVRVEVPEDGDLTRMEGVVAEHLQRFGFRETLVFDWKRPVEA